MSQSDDETELAQLRRLRKRIKNFGGCCWDADKQKYRAAVKHKVRIVGWFASELSAFRAYREAASALKPQHPVPWEPPARVERLLRLAESCPHETRQDGSLMGSSLDQNRWRDQE
jgi:hypothetical protein